MRLALATSRAELGLVLLPNAAGGRARFVEPSDGPRATAGATLARGPAAGAAPAAFTSGGDGATAIAEYCRAFAANRAGEVDDALELADRLDRRRHFAAGLALAAAIARDDQTRPTSFARDAARNPLRATQGASADPQRAWRTAGRHKAQKETIARTETISDAPAAARAAPDWWAPELVLSRALAPAVWTGTPTGP